MQLINTLKNKTNMKLHGGKLYFTHKKIDIYSA